MAGKLNGKKIAILATDGVEQVELVEPRKALERGGRGDRAGLPRGRRDPGVEPHRQGRHLPGRRGGRRRRRRRLRRPDAARRRGQSGLPADGRRRGAVRPRFFDGGKPVAAICHGPWTLVEAGVVAGRTLTSWPSLQTDIRNAGGTWVDEQVHRRRGPRHQPQARRPPGLQREDDRGVRGGPPRGPHHEPGRPVHRRLSERTPSPGSRHAPGRVGRGHLAERPLATWPNHRWPLGRRATAGHLGEPPLATWLNDRRSFGRATAGHLAEPPLATSLNDRRPLG